MNLGICTDAPLPRCRGKQIQAWILGKCTFAADEYVYIMGAQTFLGVLGRTVKTFSLFI
jgi:hypothetical protein